MTKIERLKVRREAEKANEKDFVTLITTGIYTVIFVSFVWLILAM